MAEPKNCACECHETKEEKDQYRAFAEHRVCLYPGCRKRKVTKL
jgi:hypothetical protein